MIGLTAMIPLILVIVYILALDRSLFAEDRTEDKNKKDRLHRDRTDI